MTVRSQQLAVGVVGNVATTILTVPAGHRYIIKSVMVYNAGALAETDGRILINGVGTAGAIASIHKFSNIPSNFGAVLDLWWVLNAGDTMQLIGGVGGVLRYNVSGADLVE